MPRYFFDWEVNGAVTRDQLGQDLVDVGIARRLASDGVLAAFQARDPAVDFFCACSIRDEGGGHVFRSSLGAGGWTPEMQAEVNSRAALRAAARAARLEALSRRVTKARAAPQSGRKNRLKR